MTTSQNYTAARIKKRSLPDLLVHKFLTEYGYDHGPVIARAIVDDILSVLEQCYAERVPPRTVVWLAVRRSKRGRRKGIEVRDLVPVHLEIYTEAEVGLLTDPALRKQRQGRRSFNRARFARWCFEAYEQGGVLTLLDLALLSGLSEHYASKVLREYEAETGEVVPTRGTVHDLGPAVTHKAEIVRRWLRHQSPARIARETQHAQASVDRYIADYQKVRLLAQKVPAREIGHLSGLSAGVVEEYLALLAEYEPDLALVGSGEEDRAAREAAKPAASARQPGAQPGSRAKRGAPLDAGEQRATLKQPLA